jgi:hypothetical protein
MGCISLGAKFYHYDLGAYGAMLEWAIFNMTFVIFALLARLMPYKLDIMRKQLFYVALRSVTYCSQNPKTPFTMIMRIYHY